MNKLAQAEAVGFPFDRASRATRVIRAIVHGMCPTYKTNDPGVALDAYNCDLIFLGIANMPVGMVRRLAESIAQGEG